MEALDILEKRIDTLSRIMGRTSEQNSLSNANDDGSDSTKVVGESIVDSLVSANNIINEAICGRENIKKIVGRSDELEKYLDPHFLEENQHVRAKEVYINAVGHELHMQFQQLDKIKELEPTLGAEYFRNIPGECIGKLNQIRQDNGEYSQQADLIEESLILAMKRYGEIQTGLLESLNTMNKRLEAVEDKLQEKKKQDMEKTINLEEPEK